MPEHVLKQRRRRFFIGFFLIVVVVGIVGFVYKGGKVIDPTIAQVGENEWRVFFWTLDEEPNVIRSVTGVLQ